MELRSKYVCPSLLPSPNWKPSSTLAVSDETSKLGSRMTTKETVPDRPVAINLKKEHRSTLIVTKTSSGRQVSDRLIGTGFLSKRLPTNK
ncbi:hypothetical protein CHS0354_014127 [Potamilus streckersoni]|uniref:Uncharacterized protein n=1 Tax=Potamilus streckersoni TaxID=2493646 RepID=A0AAE0WEK2_9BIVA|nr:hypothetical protein CHS0354_014127 [Potamilus streckersoni]